MRVLIDAVPCDSLYATDISQISIERMQSAYLSMALGGNGWELIKDTVVHTRDYYKLIPWTNGTSISAITFYPSYSGNWLNNIAGVSIPNDDRGTIYGDISSVQLSSGSMMAYFMY